MNIDSEIIHSASTINERKRKKNWIDRCGRSRWVTNSLESQSKVISYSYFGAPYCTNGARCKAEFSISYRAFGPYWNS